LDIPKGIKRGGYIFGQPLFPCLLFKLKRYAQINLLVFFSKLERPIQINLLVYSGATQAIVFSNSSLGKQINLLVYSGATQAIVFSNSSLGNLGKFLRDMDDNLGNLGNLGNLRNPSRDIRKAIRKLWIAPEDTYGRGMRHRA